MLSVSNLMTLWLEVDSVEELADLVSAGAGRADYSANCPIDLFLASYEIWNPEPPGPQKWTHVL